eukprot:29023-Chlamydomonas_euryale.AAC.10
MAQLPVFPSLCLVNHRHAPGQSTAPSALRCPETRLPSLGPSHGATTASRRRTPPPRAARRLGARWPTHRTTCQTCFPGCMQCRGCLDRRHVVSARPLLRRSSSGGARALRTDR